MWLSLAPILRVFVVCLCLCLPVCVAEREVVEACVRQLESSSLPAGVRDLLAPQVALFAAASVERELPWYMAQEIIPPRVRDTHVYG